MRSLICLNKDLCVGCNHCVRICPMEMANQTYLDEGDDIKVQVDTSQCIACGACIRVCRHKARYYKDDLDAFFRTLRSGEHIMLLVAPSARTNIPNMPRLFTWLRNLGVSLIGDVSLGADICVWAHLRYLRENPSFKLITQPCPSIVSYCEKKRHELLPHLSPVHSPMACLAVYMRKYLGFKSKMAALSPCIAKANEFSSTGLSQVPPAKPGA